MERLYKGFRITNLLNRTVLQPPRLLGHGKSLKPSHARGGFTNILVDIE
ncbi:hypothetical protein [Nodularia spumigena]|nr:hypothetical protein [Nodularia spumigena]MDB9323584.1 hypothetical protein [Nodularia spumigena CS-591/07A]MDB9331533.1 hypothetical protein [Nodularia spumigena CS-591/04]MDB9360797.1 hypothetical protein [Nodularia spumigena CS-588/02]MDB9367059.1 hypothetical protein [Nodularia spumigena CS-588/02A10]MDB9399808.1 hypothetical protein [Microcystis aeruginosa CS-567/02-A1]MDB9533749.1 hypothetical protein [Nodularia spumigena CS-1038]